MAGVPQPMRGDNKFKLGVFSANSDGGLALTRVPERWPAHWSEIVDVAQMADRAGIEFFLPIARWKGFGGELNSREWSYETFTFAAALAGVTQRIALFSTVHVPMVHPVYAAKALATVDHASNGRAGLNIVCGWNPEEFALFGLPMIDERYAQGLEWFEIIERIYNGETFDYDGAFYKLKGVSGQPAPVQRPRPPLVIAANGLGALRVAAAHADVWVSFGPEGATLETQVNSSHHQAIRVPGRNLRLTAVSPIDGVIEAVERTR